MISTAPLPVVFIPGASSDDTSWAAQRDYFAKKTTAIAVNLTAFDNVGAMADYVLKTAPAEFALCGTSMGGYVALDVLKKGQGRVKKVILCNTSARADTPERKLQRQAEVDLGEKTWLAARQDDTHYNAFLSEKSARDKALIARLREISMRVGYGCFARHQAACAARVESLGFLSQIKLPVLVIGGAEDKLIPPELQAEIHQNIAGSLFTLIPDTGHVTNLEAPEAMTAVIDKFLFAA